MAFSADDPKWTAYVLNELSTLRRAEVQRELDESPEARLEVAEIIRAVETIAVVLKADASPGLTAQQREAICAHEPAAVSPTRAEGPLKVKSRHSRFRLYTSALAAMLLIAAGLFMSNVQRARDAAQHQNLAVARSLAPVGKSLLEDAYEKSESVATPAKPAREKKASTDFDALIDLIESTISPDTWGDAPGQGSIKEFEANLSLVVEHSQAVANEIVGSPADTAVPVASAEENPGLNTDSYDHIVENPFLSVRDNALSTFSIDVDTASYSLMRRYLTVERQLPPKGAVRIEELINYFRYDYPQPDGDVPFSANVEVAGCPWNAAHRLVRVGLKGKEIAADHRPPSNLVFLIDVSGSMDAPNRLPLVKRSLKLLIEQLRENDRVAIVVYAGQAGLVLPSTSALERRAISEAVDRLEAGGSTNGGQGIQLAYDTALANFVKGGTNRVILATDGDFNVGTTDRTSLIELVTEKAKKGVFLTALGFGMGNLKDSTLVQLADKGNGNYGYIDDLPEARKLFVEQLAGTLVTIAKDVKIQIEFNPAQVESYRLIGYEKRALRNEDFNDDTKDAGEIGAGHSVTALYELVPAGRGERSAKVDPLKYQKRPAAALADSDELLTLKLRYKQPDGEKSALIERAAKDTGRSYAQASPDFKFAASVALFGMILRDSAFKGDGSLASVHELASEGLGADQGNYRAEFLKLVEAAKGLQRGQ